MQSRRCENEEWKGNATRGHSKLTLKECSNNKEMQIGMIEGKANKKRPKGNANQKVIADSIVKEMQSGRQGGEEPPKQTNKH